MNGGAAVVRATIESELAEIAPWLNWRGQFHFFIFLNRNQPELVGITRKTKCLRRHQVSGM